MSSEKLNNNIAVVKYDTTGSCDPENFIAFEVGPVSTDTIILYHNGSFFRAKVNKTGKITFTNLPTGAYYATIISGGVIIGTSEEVGILPIPTNPLTKYITSTTAHISVDIADCVGDEFLYQEKGADHWRDAEGNILYGLKPSTIYYWKAAARTFKNGITVKSRFIPKVEFTTASALTADNLQATNIKSSQLAVLPNPAKSSFKILFSSTFNNNANAILYDVNGKAVWTSGLINANTLNGKQVNASQLAKGVFYLKLMNRNGKEIGSTKIVIAK